MESTLKEENPDDQPPKRTDGSTQKAPKPTAQNGVDALDNDIDDDDDSDEEDTEVLIGSISEKCTFSEFNYFLMLEIFAE